MTQILMKSIPKGFTSVIRITLKTEVGGWVQIDPSFSVLAGLTRFLITKDQPPSGLLSRSVLTTFDLRASSPNSISCSCLARFHPWTLGGSWISNRRTFPETSPSNTDLVAD